MKLRTLILLPALFAAFVATLLICRSYAIDSEPKLSLFHGAKDDIKAVATWAMEAFSSYADENGNLSVTSSSGKVYLNDVEVSLPEDTAESLRRIKDVTGHSFISVKKDHVIFWRDETGGYGILFAKTPSVLRELRRTLPQGFELHRLTVHIYELGHFGR